MKMRKRILLSVVAVFLACLTAQAQEAKPTGELPKSNSASMEKMSKKPISITGRVSSDGMTLVDEKDSKAWKVMNPDFVKENAGQRVRVSARFNRESSEILVSSVMEQDEEPVVAKKDDSAFRR
jgi:curli biogenesis system outer membrane secretion channel CsgG